MAAKYQVKFKGAEEVAAGTRLFRFEKPENFQYQAGQTIDLILPKLTGSNAHTFSLVTEPVESDLAIATRMRGSDYKNTLNDLLPDDLVEIEGPYGSFALHQNEQKSAVFLVGGIGITPFMSMIKEAKSNQKPHKLYLFYSNNEPKDAPFLSELSDLSNSKALNLNFIPTMTKLDESDDWSGERGYIDWPMVKRHVPDTDKAIYYMAGPQGMVQAMRSMLLEAKVDPDSIRFEEFSGY
ncbi:MAG: FAD-dependent oxidoreductase [Candidatus Nomurabacteria bacterium]|nr:FAD-dependent oxidoreductase [Candidatus Nomurabacteria bacterium]USN88187.1 MAG: FAD-dependent oxidoreductase [Candidatus Nomurabacteria bacterium]